MPTVSFIGWNIFFKYDNQKFDWNSGDGIGKGGYGEVKLFKLSDGKSVAIKRDNPDDTLHFGKEISLKIYDRHEIAAGHSRYQIVQQPIFKTKSDIHILHCLTCSTFN